jgi:hypothetical protein
MQKINAASRDNTEKSETQKLNWMTQEQILETYEKLKNEADPLIKKKNMKRSKRI